MNKKILIVALTLLLSLTAFAQRPDSKKINFFKTFLILTILAPQN